MVAGVDVGHAFANRLDDAGTLVAENDGEGTLGVLAGQRVGICRGSAFVACAEGTLRGRWSRLVSRHLPVWQTPV